MIGTSLSFVMMTFVGLQAGSVHGPGAGGSLPPVAGPGQGAGRAAIDACDDFNRVNSSNLGPSWLEVQGDMAISNNTGFAVGGVDQYIINQDALAGVFGSEIKVDFLPKVQGGDGVYVAVIAGYWDDQNCVFIKVQDDNIDGLYDTVYFYGGVNGGDWGQANSSFSLATQAVGGTMTVSFINGGDTAVCDIFNATSGATEHFESDGLLSSGMIFGLQFGICASGSPAFDNFEVNDGCSAAPALTVQNLIAGSTATIMVENATPNSPVGVGWSIAGNGPTTISAGSCGMIAVDLSAPLNSLPIQNADASGVATWNVQVPANALGQTAYFHALDLNSCALSNSFGLTVF